MTSPASAALTDTDDALAFTLRWRRRLLGAGSLLAAASFVAAPIVAPWEGDGEWIATIAQYPARGQAGAVLYWLGFLMTICTVLSLAAMVRRRSVRLGLIGTVLAVLGAAAQPGLLISDFFQLGMGQTLPLETALAVEEQMEQYWGLPILYVTAFFGGMLGSTLLIFAAWRARWLSPVVPALHVVSVGIMVFVPTTEQLPSIAAWSLGATIHVLVALRVLRASDAEWASGLPVAR